MTTNPIAERACERSHKLFVCDSGTLRRLQTDAPPKVISDLLVRA